MTKTTPNPTPSTCGLIPAPKPETSTLKKIFRRVKQQIIPTHARVRYDTRANMWAVLDEQNAPIRHFTEGYMTDCVFSTATVDQKVAAGCGPATVQHVLIGIASGNLVENAMCQCASGMRNMRFHEGFRDDTGTIIERASTVALLPNRRAMFRP